MNSIVKNAMAVVVLTSLCAGVNVSIFALDDGAAVEKSTTINHNAAKIITAAGIGGTLIGGSLIAFYAKKYHQTKRKLENRSLSDESRSVLHRNLAWYRNALIITSFITTAGFGTVCFGGVKLLKNDTPITDPETAQAALTDPEIEELKRQGEMRKADDLERKKQQDLAAKIAQVAADKRFDDYKRSLIQQKKERLEAAENQ